MVSQCVDGGGFEAIVDSCEARVSRAGGAFEAFLNCSDDVIAVVAGRLHLPAFNALLASELTGAASRNLALDDGKVFLARRPNTSWLLRRAPEAARRLHATPRHTLTAHLSGAPVRVQRFGVPRADWGAGRLGVPASDLGEELLAPSALCAQDGRTEILDLSCAHPALLLELTSRPIGHHAYMIDRETLQAIEVLPSQAGEERLIGIFDLLGELRHKVALDVIRTFLRHGSYRVRWAAARTMSRIDPECTPEVMRRLTSDENLLVSSAASQALAAATA